MGQGRSLDAPLSCVFTTRNSTSAQNMFKHNLLVLIVRLLWRPLFAYACQQNHEQYRAPAERQ